MGASIEFVTYDLGRQLAQFNYYAPVLLCSFEHDDPTPPRLTELVALVSFRSRVLHRQLLEENVEAKKALEDLRKQIRRVSRQYERVWGSWAHEQRLEQARFLVEVKSRANPWGPLASLIVESQQWEALHQVIKELRTLLPSELSAAFVLGFQIAQLLHDPEASRSRQIPAETYLRERLIPRMAREFRSQCRQVPALVTLRPLNRMPRAMKEVGLEDWFWIAVRALDRTIESNLTIGPRGPFFDVNSRELFVDGRFVKKFWKDCDQTTILRHLQQNCWKQPLSDPLPNAQKGKRLTNAMKYFNRAQNVIRLSRDPQGIGFVWTLRSH